MPDYPAGFFILPDIQPNHPAWFFILPDYPAGYPAYPAGYGRHRTSGIRHPARNTRSGPTLIITFIFTKNFRDRGRANRIQCYQLGLDRIWYFLPDAGCRVLAKSGRICRISGRIIRQNDKSGRMIWPHIRQNEKSGRIIRHCRISGPTLIKTLLYCLKLHVWLGKALK